MSTAGQPNLAQVQNWMQSALVRKDSRVQTANPEYVINESSRLSAAQHLGIYRRSYFARLRECMKNQFSALAFALGEDLFQMFADQYLDAYPSGSYTLSELGAKFPDFLEETRPDAGMEEKESWIDFVIELARFEFTLSLIFDEQADAAGLADESARDEHLSLVPTFRLFYHRYPVCRYYLDVTRGKEPELPLEADTYCAVTRNDFRLNLLEIKPAQYHFLERLAKGETVAQAKDYFVHIYGFDTKNLENVWQIWRKSFIASGFFSDDEEIKRKIAHTENN